MIGEFDVLGVFVPAFLVSAVLAFVLTQVVKQLLRLVRFYRLVWHPALFDTSLFVLFWCAITAATARLTPHFSGGG